MLENVLYLSENVCCPIKNTENNPVLFLFSLSGHESIKAGFFKNMYLNDRIVLDGASFFFLG